MYKIELSIKLSYDSVELLTGGFLAGAGTFLNEKKIISEKNINMNKMQL